MVDFAPHPTPSILIKQVTPVPSAGFDPAIPALEWPQTNAFTARPSELALFVVSQWKMCAVSTHLRVSPWGNAYIRRLSVMYLLFRNSATSGDIFTTNALSSIISDDLFYN